MATAPASYPLTFNVEPQLTNRNRKTCFFRLIWALPHLLIVGSSVGAPVTLILSAIFFIDREASARFAGVGGGGGLAAVAATMSIIVWFSIMFAHKHPPGLWDFAKYYMRWRAYVNTYVSLLRDEYPPFGTGGYPAEIEIADQPEDSARRSIGWRFLMIIPNAIVLFFVGVAAFFVWIIAWLAILITGSLPAGLARFLTGYLRWSLRLEGYLLLMYDTYPPYGFD